MRDTLRNPRAQSLGFWQVGRFIWYMLRDPQNSLGCEPHACNGAVPRHSQENCWSARVRAVPAILLAIAFLTQAGCENRPTGSRTPLPLHGDFRAYSVDDERRGAGSRLDTVSVYLFGDGVSDNAAVSVNGTPIPRVATAGNQALFGRVLPMQAGEVLEVEVSTTWRSVRNTIALPATRPILDVPAAGAVLDRNAPAEIRWSGLNEGNVGVQIHRITSTGALGDTLWTATAAAGDGKVVVPSGIWGASNDSTALLSLWHESFAQGEGFAGTLYMSAGFGVRRVIRVN